jgi:hypothetical protein
MPGSKAIKEHIEQLIGALVADYAGTRGGGKNDL